jgi:hypothetical protein
MIAPSAGSPIQIMLLLLSAKLRNSASLARIAASVRRWAVRSMASDPKDSDAGSPHYEDGYAAAVATLRRAGIEAEPDAASYADQRLRWEPLIRRVAPTFGYGMDEIDLRRPGQISSDGKSANRRWSTP